MKEYTVDFVVSKDGTKIGYRQMGSGPGLILVHGGLQSSLNFTKLGELLSDMFTIYIPDRRGRGLSGPLCDDYDLQKEVEDMEALLIKTSAHNVFGLSSGALLSLRAALDVQTIHKVALYEPPLTLSGHRSFVYWAPQYEEQLSHGNLGGALVNIFKGTGATTFVTFLPRFLLNYMINSEAKKAKTGEVTLKELIPTMRFDNQLVKDMENGHENFNAMQAKALLLGGNKSPAYLKDALDFLEKILPNVERINFKGVGHLAADNSGKPELVANELRRFFKN